MNLRYLNLFFIALVALTACGSEPEPPRMDRRFLAGDYLEQEKTNLLANVDGEVLDQYEWTFGEQKVFTILSRERDPETSFQGIYLRQYDLSGQHAALLWTYQDSLSCAAAGAVDVTDLSPELRPVRIRENAPEGFVLAYDLACRSEEAGRNVIVVDAASGTPSVRLSGTNGSVDEAEGLHGLPAVMRERLVAMLLR